MKKILIIGLAIGVVTLFSLSVLAQDPVTEEDFVIDEGWYNNYSEAQEILSATQVKTATGTNHVTVDGVKVTGNTPDYSEEDYIGDQEINVTINTSAMIPCYLEMELVGNAGYTKAKSIGANAVANVDRTSESHWMLFNPEFGGMMDSDWNLLATEDVQDFSTLGLDNGYYINACDIWTANLFGNIAYGFDINASPLTNGSDSFNMDMRLTGEDISETGGDEYLALGQANLGSFGALDETSLFMQFRVPFNRDVPAGQYDGDVTFSMYSV